MSMAANLADLTLYRLQIFANNVVKLSHHTFVGLLRSYTNVGYANHFMGCPKSDFDVLR